MSARILVADDDPAVRRIIGRALAPVPGCEVSFAEDSDAAEGLIQARRPDLLLLDIGLPGRDGLSLLRELRARPETRLLPVIVVSGQGSESSRVGGLTEGADDYVVKPFSPGELAARVSRLLERRRQDLCANPLTGLPGSPAIAQDVTRRIAAGEPFALCHVDIDRFKSYNDRYGFARGDRLIGACAALLRRCAADAGRGLFVGHIGGDDFTLAGEPAAVRAAAETFARAFDLLAASFYDREDAERGFVTVRDRRGDLVPHSLVSVSIGGATTETRPYSCYAEAAQVASEMKSFLKSRRGATSACAFDRRSR